MTVHVCVCILRRVFKQNVTKFINVNIYIVTVNKNTINKNTAVSKNTAVNKIQ